MTGMIEAVIISIAMVGALIGFLKYNWYPAKIFGGDGLTLMVGATIAVVSIIGNMEKIGIVLLVLFFIELYLKSKTRFQGESFGQPTKNGFLLAPKNKVSLTHYFMFGKATEKQIVKRILLTQFLICILVFVTAYSNHIGIIMI